MNTYKIFIYKIGKQPPLLISKFSVKAPDKDTAWDHAIGLSFENLFKKEKMVYLQEEYNLF